MIAIGEGGVPVEDGMCERLGGTEGINDDVGGGEGYPGGERAAWGGLEGSAREGVVVEGAIGTNEFEGVGHDQAFNSGTSSQRRSLPGLGGRVRRVGPRGRLRGSRAGRARLRRRGGGTSPTGL